MADLKISQLPVASTPLAGTELVPIVQGGTTDQTTVEAILTGTVPSGTANGVLYLNGSKVVTSGGGFTYNGATTVRISSAGGGYLQGAAGEILAGQDAGGFYYGTGFSVNPAIPIFIGNSGATFFESRVATAASYRWFLGAGEQMRLNSTGLGIGTNNPTDKFVVENAAANVTARISAGGTASYTASLAMGTTTRDWVLTAGSNATNYRLSLSYVGTDAPASGILQIAKDGNLGLGVTPSAWSTGVAIQTRGAGIWDNGTNNTYYAQNAFFNGTNWVYRNSFAASSYLQTNGTHVWYSAGVGVANNGFSFSQQMHLSASGNLGIGGVTPPSMSGVSGLVGNYLNIVGGIGFYASGNSYYDTTWKYYGTGTAGLYEIIGAQHTWKNISVSGTAGNTISFTQAMTLDSGGNLLLGQTSDAFTSANRVVLGINGATDSSITLRASGTLQGFLLGGASQFVIGSNAVPIVFQRSSGGTESMRIDANGNVVINTAAIATNATNGFLYVPTCAGTPTGTPTTYTGRSPIVVDTTNNKLYFYSGGAWRDAGP